MKTPHFLASVFALLPLAGMAGVIADNIAFVDPKVTESCEETPVERPESRLVEKNGRLIPELRQAARLGDPVSNFEKATEFYARGDEQMGNAYADLAVTGRKSYSQFKKLHEAGALNKPGLERALSRAYLVAHVLAFANAPQRKGLGYIAVSGEDDLPGRPVNVPATSYLQHDLEVRVGDKVVNTRYMIAESFKDVPAIPEFRDGQLPSLPSPTLSDNARVLIYVHGMDSRLEEASDLFNSLQKIGKKTGENWTIISMDLPTSGYADQLNHLDISPMEALGRPRLIGFNAQGTQNVPVLNFIEDFVVNFVNTLDQKVPFKGKIEAVIGGSLGGNLTFRLGRRQDVPWLKNIVTWSPASIWRGLADVADLFKQVGVATGWKRAGGNKKELVEVPQMREKFFEMAFGGALKIGPIEILPAQPDQWWRKSWACFKSSRLLSEIDRQEIYSDKFRLWHWRLGTEQLIFSQQKAPDLTGPRYLDNHVRMLLACGTSDDFNFTNICSSTLKTAKKMISTPGRALIISDTGHSIHNERPNFFAGEIVKFLNER